MVLSKILVILLTNERILINELKILFKEEMIYMFGISIVGLLIRFVIGGIAVATASIVAGKVGGKIGGIIATMPAVFIAAMLSLSVDHKGNDLITAGMNLSSGAVMGITSCILTVAITSIYVSKHGFKKGAAFSVACWFLISCALFTIKNL